MLERDNLQASGPLKMLVELLRTLDEAWAYGRIEQARTARPSYPLSLQESISLVPLCSGGQGEKSLCFHASVLRVIRILSICRACPLLLGPFSS